MLQPDDPGNESRFWHHSEWIPTHGPQETQPQEYNMSWIGRSPDLAARREGYRENEYS